MSAMKAREYARNPTTCLLERWCPRCLLALPLPYLSLWFANSIFIMFPMTSLLQIQQVCKELCAFLCCWCDTVPSRKI